MKRKAERLEELKSEQGRLKRKFVKTQEKVLLQLLLFDYITLQMFSACMTHMVSEKEMIHLEF